MSERTFGLEGANLQRYYYSGIWDWWMFKNSHGSSSITCIKFSITATWNLTQDELFMNIFGTSPLFTDTIKAWPSDLAQGLTR
ncbi:hypothetical protein NC651_012421 [Populus alba x Populus x berolinensis]|nr:hypothetical protein NC651_012421 [Populus alba x Populus x berolinensis]